MIALLAACRGDEEIGPPAITTTTLPDAVAGEVYAGHLAASGAPPLRWTLADGTLPDGLVFNPAGAVSGVPVEAGEATLDVEVADAEGRTDRATFTLRTAWPADAVPCGEELSDRLRTDADEGLFGVDWDETGGYRWLLVPLPPPEITRIELVATSVDTAWTAYVGAPGAAVGTRDLARDTTFAFPFLGTLATIDLASEPYDLQTYRALGDPIAVLLVASERVDFGIRADCTDGPVLERTYFDPVRLGDGMDVDWEAVGVPDATFSTGDPLPPGVSLESDGHVTGVPTVAGVWELVLRVEDPAGPVRDVPTALGVYEVAEAPCGTVVDFVPELGEILSPWPADPRIFQVVRTPIPPGTSAVSATLTGQGFREVTTARPGSLAPWDGGGEWAVSDSSPITAEVSPQSYPALGAYLAEGEVYSTVTSLFPDGPLALEVACDPGPRLDLAGLPVILGDVTHGLSAIGGTPPYTFAAAGLPAGVTLDPDGTLGASGAAPGTLTVDVTVTDSLGATEDRALPLSVGATAACDGVPILGCGEEASGTFTLGVFDEITPSPASTAHRCLAPPVPATVSLTVSSPADADLALAIVDPGRSADEALARSGAVAEYVASAGPGDAATIALDGGTFPGLDDWADLPLLVQVQAYYPGDWTLSLACPGP